MSSVNDTKAAQAAALIPAAAELSRFVPEPKNRMGFSFATLLKQLGSTALNGVSAYQGIDPNYQELLQKQIELQEQMMVVSMSSNLERTRHETRMAAVRNLRVA